MIKKKPMTLISNIIFIVKATWAIILETVKSHDAVIHTSSKECKLKTEQGNTSGSKIM